MTLYRDISIWKLISGLIKNKKDEARPPTTEHQIKNLTNRIISASACLWTLWDPFPLSLPLEPPREHSRVRLICLMTPLCITVLYNRPLPYWFGIFSYGSYFFGHCLLKSGTLPSSFTDARFYFRFAWFVLEGLIVWLSEAGRGGEGRGEERDCRFRDLLPSAGRYSLHAVVRNTFGSLPNRPCLEEINNSRPEGCFEHMIDWQYFSLGYQTQEAFSPKVHLEVFLCQNVMVKWYVTRPKN